MLEKPDFKKVEPISYKEFRKIKVIYCVPWVEVEFGQRDEGWSIFLDKDECIKQTKEDSRKGCYVGGYLGPERPLHYYEIPITELESWCKKKIRIFKKLNLANKDFNPQFKSKAYYIT